MIVELTLKEKSKNVYFALLSFTIAKSYFSLKVQ